MFRAIVLRQPAPEAAIAAAVESVSEDDLPTTGEGDVTVRVDYSTINFKDGLAITGGRGRPSVVRKFPMVPGIDFAGTVEQSDDPMFSAGDAVILNGWGVGETHWGGLAQRARVKAAWLTPKPKALNAKQCMAIGTAGYTAMLCVQALQRHGVHPNQGEVLVTGAAGGVGSMAVAILKALGFEVVASTGRMEEENYLKSLGAKAVLPRAELSSPGKPLQKERWAAVVDSVGSHTLVNACAATKSFGAVAACGLAQGMDFPATVAPFILRGVVLYGINSVTQPAAARESAWKALGELLKPAAIDAMTTEIGLEAAIAQADAILEGKVRGRLVVNVND